MFRPARLVRAAALALLLTVFLTGAATAADPEAETIVRVELDLPLGDGFHAHLETSEKEVVKLEILRKREGMLQAVIYEVPGRVSEAGLKVSFGRLGRIDAAFTPTATLDETQVSPGCTGAPRTLRDGIFAGTISIAGERGYARIDVPQVEGSMSVIPPWSCPEEDGLSPFESIPGVPQLAARPRGKKEESATLVVIGPDFLRFFGAGVHHRHSGGRSIFYGAETEKRGKMEVTRVTSVRGPASAFDFDHEAGTAALHAPRPLHGHAVFKRRKLWRSTIRVPLLGAAPLWTGEPGFGVALYPEYQFD